LAHFLEIYCVIRAVSVADDRRNRILELIRQRGFASLPALAEALEVSESTVRRDLDFLDESGVVQRTHGGVFYTGPSPKLAHFDQRQSLNWDKKRQIAVAASRLIDDNDTILLDGGSTTYELAQLLVGRPLQVVTNSLPVANLFTSSESTDLVIVGGYVHAKTGVSLGPYANQMLGGLNVRRAVLSVAGINERGCYNSNLLLVETERAMMNSAEEVIVVADSTKLGHTSLAHLCQVAELNVLVTDDGITDEWRRRLAEAEVKLVVAEERRIDVSPAQEEAT
jgi:DeoR family transcriptional regulator, fructose operon transcriptional repressor